MEGDTEMNNEEKYLYTSIKDLGIDLNEDQIEKFMKYYHFLVEKNKVMNLTAITDFKEVVRKHFYDSLSLVKVLDVRRKKNVIDIGTGAGFPGIPIKIVYPEINIVLLDSLRKRVDFLNETIDLLKLDSITAVHGRSEDLAHRNEYREKFDLCVSRAVASLPVLCELTLPFVRVNGHFVAYKGSFDTANSEIEDSKNALSILGSEMQDVKYFSPVDMEYQRTLLLIHKIRQISGKYPRKAGTPSKDPL